MTALLSNEGLAAYAMFGRFLGPHPRFQETTVPR